MIRSRYLKRLPVISRSASFTPTSISGLALWLDGADAASVTLDGSNMVSQWSDKSGNGRHASQATVLSRPAYSTAAVNGLNAVTFDGVNDVLDSSSSLVASDGSYTMFGVARKLSNANLAYFLAGPAGLACGIEGATTRPGVLVNAVNWFAEPSAVSIGTTICQSLRRQSGSFRYNRSGIVLTSSLNPTVYGTNYRIGTHGVGVFQNVIVCEVLHYSAALTDTEIARVESYLSAKWGTS